MTNSIIPKPVASAKQLVPGAGRIAVQLVKANQKWVGTSGVELWIPDISFSGRDGESNIGIVVAVCEPYLKITAEGTEKLTSDYVLGDIVIFGKYTGTEVIIGRDRFIIMFDTDILAEWRGELPTEAVADDNHPSYEDTLRSAGNLHFEAPAPRRDGALPPLPPGISGY
jgi:co-chaperonin GroES (HSP10)